MHETIYSFPRLVVEYPDGKSRFHIAGTAGGWELAVQKQPHSTIPAPTLSIGLPTIKTPQTRSGKVKSQHHSNTQSRELPRYLSRTARVIAGDTFHYPHYSTPTPEAKYARKKHHPHSVQNLHSLHAHSNSCNRAKHRELHDCTKRTNPLSVHGYSPATRLF